jgi:hypothetical protein
LFARSSHAIYDLQLGLAVRFVEIESPREGQSVDERSQMLAILGPSMERLKKLETAGRVSPPSELPVVNGIGFAWPMPGETKIVIHCTGPINADGALIRVGTLSSSGELEWLTHPPLFIDGKEHNPDCRYPAPRATDNAHSMNLIYKKIFNLIAILVGDPVLE